MLPVAPCFVAGIVVAGLQNQRSLLVFCVQDITTAQMVTKCQAGHAAAQNN